MSMSLAFRDVPPRWIEEYAPIPFVEKGWDFSGCHCYGLVCLLYRLRLKIQLDRYAMISSKHMFRAARALKKASEAGLWQKVSDSDPQPYDVTLLLATHTIGKRQHILPSHVGIMVSPTMMLHIEEGSGVVSQSVTDKDITWRLLNTYRHRELT